MQILYDSKCDFCSAFILRIPSFDLRDNEVLLYDLRTKEARNILKKRNVNFVNLNTIYCITPEKVMNKSKAVFAIFSRARSNYKYLSFFGKLPVTFTDCIYDFVAKNRYSISKILKKLKIIE
ncbi:MAG: DUF393 domain-containing protein [Taibaiella sp.]|nr:DUF393 domain-containing protein [Taibaiella sp.]